MFQPWSAQATSNTSAAVASLLHSRRGMRTTPSRDGAPRDPAIDSTLAIARDGYEYIWKRCLQLNSDLFVTRVLGRRTICIHGSEAAQLFYDSERLQRRGAIPRRVVTSLFGKRGVQTLDDAPHQHRKQAFMSLMSDDSLQRFAEISIGQWQARIPAWQSARSIVLFEEARRVLTATAFQWAGVPVWSNDIPRFAWGLGAMVESFGGLGPRLWRGKLARSLLERWLAEGVQQVRDGRTRAEPGTALDVMSKHRDLDGELLPPRIAAVELLNVIRPIAAIAYYIAFAGHALHTHPAVEHTLSRTTDDASYRTWVMHEIRRFYPFTPYLGARVRVPFEWRGCRFDVGTLVLLDVYGTHHDPKIWQDPERFDPLRFARERNLGFAFMPQGGGDYRRGHRCAGEELTAHSIEIALHMLTRCMTYEVPPQDLQIDLTRIPTMPGRGVVLRNVRATAELDRTVASPSGATSNVRSATANGAGRVLL